MRLKSSFSFLCNSILGGECTLDEVRPVREPVAAAVEIVFRFGSIEILIHHLDDLFRGLLAVSVGQTGTTTLKIWRKNSEKTAKKIIKQINEDFNAAKSEYNFYGCSDGLAHWPDYMPRSFATEDD